MKRTTSANFQIDVPEDWKAFRDGPRHVWQGRGPTLQELIIQGMTLEGDGAPDEESQALQALVENALQATSDTLQNPDLVVERPLQEDTSLAVQPAWSARARAPGDRTLFCGAVFRGARAVLLVTFETSPELKTDLAIFEAVVGSVRPAKEPGRGAAQDM
jgi:hypothetical protein